MISNIETKTSTGKLTYKNGNLIKKEKVSVIGGINNTTSYEYDDKYNPITTILGLNKRISLDGNEASWSTNNITKETTVNSTNTSNITTYQYVYNAAGYSTEQKMFGNDGKLMITMQFVYD